MDGLGSGFDLLLDGTPEMLDHRGQVAWRGVSLQKGPGVGAQAKD